MFKGDEIAVPALKPGMPVETTDGVGVVNSLLRHWDVKKTYLKVSLYNEKKFSDKILTYPLEASVRLLTGRMSETLQSQYKIFQRQNLASAGLFSVLGMSIGSDPEIFVTDAKGVVIPAFTFLPGKKDPKIVNLIQKAYWDGFQAEYTTNARSCLEQLCGDFRWGLNNVLTQAKLKHKDARLSIATVVDIPEKYLKEAKDEEVALGCDPSLNIYGAIGEVIPDPRQLPFRMTGGHMHFGVGEVGDNNGKHVNSAALGRIVRSLDQLIGVAGVSLFENFDVPARRHFYGLAGEYRLPYHGIEYRTMSNAWLTHPSISHLLFDTARMAIRFGFKGFNDLLAEQDDKVVQAIINNCDVKAARALMKQNEDIYKALFANVVSYNNQPEGTKISFDVIMKPVEDTVNDPTDLEKNWQLNLEQPKYISWGTRIPTVRAGKKI